MERLNVNNGKNQGFTLFEILVALIIAGVLAAMSLPSLLGILKGNELKSAQDQVINGLRDGQRQAIRRSKACEITLDTTNGQIRADGSDNVGCLSSTDRNLPNGVAMSTNISGEKVKYSFKGNTTLSDSGVIVLYPSTWKTRTWTASSAGGEKYRCIVVSPNLGIMRSGIYKQGENPKSSVISDNCQTSSSTL